MTDGLLYTLLNPVLKFLRFLNLVELFKLIAVKIGKNKVYSRTGTDAFILFKWALLLIIWTCSWHNIVITIAVWYLLITNIYTYFYYHVWSDEALNTTTLTNDTLRRRFLVLLLAIAFSDFGFAYLYKLPYAADFSANSVANYVWYSISNSFAANYNAIQPTTELGNSIAMIQLIITFIFVTIIVSRSIPETA